jgi:hypothetical protein
MATLVSHAQRSALEVIAQLPDIRVCEARVYDPAQERQTIALFHRPFLVAHRFQPDAATIDRDLQLGVWPQPKRIPDLLRDNNTAGPVDRRLHTGILPFKYHHG